MSYGSSCWGSSSSIWIITILHIRYSSLIHMKFRMQAEGTDILDQPLLWDVLVAAVRFQNTFASFSSMVKGNAPCAHLDRPLVLKARPAVSCGAFVRLPRARHRPEIVRCFRHTMRSHPRRSVTGLITPIKLDHVAPTCRPEVAKITLTDEALKHFHVTQALG